MQVDRERTPGLSYLCGPATLHSVADRPRAYRRHLLTGRHLHTSRRSAEEPDRTRGTVPGAQLDPVLPRRHPVLPGGGLTAARPGRTLLAVRPHRSEERRVGKECGPPGADERNTDRITSTP